MKPQNWDTLTLEQQAQAQYLAAQRKRMDCLYHGTNSREWSEVCVCIRLAYRNLYGKELSA